MSDSGDASLDEKAGEDWRPRAARVRAALWEAERRLNDRDWVQASVACGWALDDAERGEREVALGLRHLAAAGLRLRDGNRAAAEKQLAHARQRLAPFLPEHESVDLADLLLVLEHAVDEP